ncbi:flagellar basal body-associated protein [Solibacillus silvestris StLB046]|uniref:Flagellar protein FliL n=1 Tax=Solibacillus silvestris (strain StLB046) TaxID=1002809 RepID=F2F2W2_SOLSS|nr:flagellar basal body-associated protein FliL [Solibacillus silvestris]BAK17410.1 flagellar basal body-associated protein [Solibacillus silvestris StLB046]
MKNNKLLTIMLIILVTITLFGVIVVVLLTQLNKEKPDGPTIDEIIESSVEIPEITTNLADGSFVRITLKIQGSDKKAGEELFKRDFQVKNIVIQELSEMEEEALEGKQGKITFQDAIKSQVNELMQEGEVTQVYITSYVLQ